MRKILSIIGLLIMLSSFVLIFVGSDYKVVGETLCVDGLNRVNLEGIMCEDKVNTWFGYHQGFMFSVLILTVIGMLLVIKDAKGENHDG